MSTTNFNTFIYGKQVNKGGKLAICGKIEKRRNWIMNREILFKAKRTDNGEWVEGYYVKYQPCASRPEYVRGIVPTYASALYMIKIDPDTLCQYTGLTTRTVRKFGRMIF